MKHPKMTEWADYVRAVAGNGDREALRAHLDEGCGLCQATVTALGLVTTAAANEAAMAVPLGAVRSVKAFFSIQHSGRQGVWDELFLRRAFDSSLTPATVASRSEGEPVRQLLFESEDYTVELSLDQTPGEVDAVLRGQILEAHGEPRSHTPVFLVGDGEVIGRTISEQQGTFEMSGRLDKPCELWVFPDDEHRIRLSLAPEA